MPDQPLNEIREALARERQALLSANFEALEPLILEIARLLNDLDGPLTPASDLKLIAAKINENQNLLAAAIKGVTAARDRLHALRAVQAGLCVYDKKGTLSGAQNHPQSLEKKA